MKLNKISGRVAGGIATATTLSGLLLASPAIYHSLMRLNLENRVKNATYSCNIHCASDAHAKSLEHMSLKDRMSDKCQENECLDLAKALSELSEFERRW